MEYKVIRVYPNGWTGLNLGLLEESLNKGFRIENVQQVSDGKYTFTDYVLKKQDEEELKHIRKDFEDKHTM